jgi:hypothetical protein
MKTISKEHFGRMKLMCANFAEKSKSNALFLPEYETSKKINQMIESINKPTASDFNKIVDLIKTTDIKEHYNGAQWFDYKIHLNALLRDNGFNAHII